MTATPVQKSANTSKPKPAPRRSNGDGSILKLPNCRFWYGQFYKDGRQIRFSTKTENKTAALTILRKHMHDRDEGKSLAIANRRLRYAEVRELLLSDYKTSQNKSLKTDVDGNQYIDGLRQLDEAAEFEMVADEVTKRGLPVSQLNREFARRFTEKRLSENVGTASVNRSLAALRRMLNLAKDEGLIHEVPRFKFLPEPPARTGFLEYVKFEELLNLLPSSLKPLVEFLYSSGVRSGEALQVEWSQVDLANFTIRLEADQTKNSEARELPMSRLLHSMLSEVEPKKGRVFNDTNLRKSWERACAACGLGTITKAKSEDGNAFTKYEGLRLHDLRRSAVRNLVNADVPQTVAMKISGHKTSAVFQRYAIVSPSDKHEAQRRVEAARVKALAGPVIEAKGPAPGKRTQKRS
jgi:integrase